MAETYLKRKIDEYLRSWKEDPNRKPLIVKGPRQVGKTESILHFASDAYQSVIYINFVEEPKYKLITENGYKTDDIIRNISRMDPSKRFEPGKTLLFFDELQEYPEIATALKFFKIDGRFDVVCSGSLLGFPISELKATASVTRQITICTLWILKSFCGQKDMTGQQPRRCCGIWKTNSLLQKP